MPRPQSRPRARSAPALLASALLAGCTALPSGETDTAAASLPDPTVAVPIFAAGDAAEKDWRKVSVWGEAEFRIVALDGDVAIRAETDGSSAALVRRVDIDPETCPEVEWSWRVDRMPRTADLASRKREDVAASILFAFGDPGSFGNPENVPTLRYAWATETNPVGQVIDSPYFPRVIRTLVVRSGPAEMNLWITERRSLAADYERVFGRPPDSRIEVVAIFTDSDHDNGGATAHYRWARMLCREAPDVPSIFE